MGGRGRGVALALFAATAAVGGSAAVATAITGEVPGNADPWPTGLFAIALGLTGLLIRWRRLDHRCGWSLQIGGLLAAIGCAANWWAGETLYRDPGSLPGGGFAARVALWVYPLSVWFGFAWPLVLFPSGRPRSDRWRAFGVVAAIATGCAVLGASLFGAIAATTEAPIELLDITGIAATGWTQPALAFAFAGSVAAWLAALIALAGVAVASRRARGDEWYQLQWLLLGGAVAVAPTLIDLVIVGSDLPQWARTLALLAIPASMVLAMAHHHLYDVDLVISRSVTTVAIVAAIAVVYVGVVWALAALLGEGKELRGPPMVAAAVVAVTFAPLARLARRVVHRVTGRSADARPLVARLGAQLEQITAEDDLLDQLAATVASELRLRRVTIELDGARADVGDTSSGDASHEAEAMTIPLMHRGEQVGTMRLVPRRGERLGRAERRTAGELSRLVAVAALAIRLGDDLEASKRQLEHSHDDERRRVRRDLHDGLGPTLASLRLKLGLLQRHVDAPASSVLEELKADVSDAVREVRRIVDGLQPSTVEDLGLVPAVRLLADDVNRAGSGGGPVIVVTADDDVGELPAALAGAAYRVVGEALANVVRHSRARRCEVSIRRDGALDLRISDDGVGFDPRHVGGTGLRSIRTRVEELGGRTEVTARPGAGTTLEVSLPWS